MKFSDRGMADWKDHVCVDLTFHKTLPTLPVYKRRAESRRQPAPSAGEWPRQPTAARQPPPPTTRPTPPARRQPTTPENETTPPAPQTLQIDTPATITVQRPPKTAQVTPETSYTASFSRITTDKEAENKVAGDEHYTHAVLPCQH